MCNNLEHVSLNTQIPSTATEEELRDLFSPYGTLVDLALLKKNPGAGARDVLSLLP